MLSTQGPGGIGIATAPHWSGPFTAQLEAPLFNGYCEDPTIYLDPKRGTIHMIAHGELAPQPRFNVGVHAVSHDGLRWSNPQVHVCPT